MILDALVFGSLTLGAAAAVAFYLRATSEPTPGPAAVVAPRAAGSIGTRDHAGLQVVIVEPPLRPLPAAGSPVWRDRAAAMHAAVRAQVRRAWTAFLDEWGIAPARTAGVR